MEEKREEETAGNSVISDKALPSPASLNAANSNGNHTVNFESEENKEDATVTGDENPTQDGGNKPEEISDNGPGEGIIAKDQSEHEVNGGADLCGEENVEKEEDNRHMPSSSGDADSFDQNEQHDSTQPKDDHVSEEKDTVGNGVPDTLVSHPEKGEFESLEKDEHTEARDAGNDATEAEAVGDQTNAETEAAEKVKEAEEEKNIVEENTGENTCTATTVTGVVDGGDKIPAPLAEDKEEIREACSVETKDACKPETSSNTETKTEEKEIAKNAEVDEKPKECKEKASTEESKPQGEAKTKPTEAAATESTSSASSSANSSNSTGKLLTKTPRPRCPKCNRAVRDKAALETHVCEKEAEDEVKVKITISSNKEKETFTCQDCNFTGGERPFSEHLMCHLMLRPYQCLHCKECFINRKETSIHVHNAHNGAKLSCALSTPRALKKAKALIKEANNCGIISFMARVGAKVPLERDPERPAAQLISAKHIEEKKKEEAAETVRDSEANRAKPEEDTSVPSEKEDCENSTGKQGEDKGKEIEEEELASKAVSDVAPAGFSKLREVLTASPTVLPSSHEPDKTESESGPRIIDSFSLNDNEAQSSQRTNGQAEPMEEDEAASELVPAPSGNQDDNQSEIMSFLGPEQPMYRTAEDENLAPLLAPPPLIPAPSSLDDNFPPPPQLSSASSVQPLSRQPEPSHPPKKNPNFFVCGFNCLFSSLSAEEFQEHTINFHSSEAFYPCFHCGHSSTNEADLVSHLVSHTQAQDKNSPLFVCGHDDSCQFGTNMVGDYINHMRMTHPEVLEPTCFSCGDGFEDLPSLQRHIEQNVLHVVNCPHCSNAATERRAILNHISAAHPGKPKMVSVAKQLICHERKLNNYAAMKRFREMQPPTLTPAPSLTSPTMGSSSRSSGGSVVDQILSRHGDTCGRGSTLSDILTGRTSISGGHSSAASLASAGSSNGREPSPDLSAVVVKNEVAEEEEEDCFGLSRRPLNSPEESSNYMIDENGVRRRIYVPMSERQAENFKCRHCTFIARDTKRLHCHERSHGMPPTRKDRFKCMFCPQGFDSEMKFRLHITCHPGIIRFLLYRCNKCEFDTNKKDTIVKHITCNRDKKHRGTGPVEAQYSTVSRTLVSRVLLCEKCDYMTRHKIHMAIHYQRAHSILRDKSDFVVEGLEPIDTPVSSFEDERDEDEMNLTMADPSYASSTSSISSPNLQAALKSPVARPASNGSAGAAAVSFDFPRPTGSVKRPRDRDRHIDQPVLTVEQVNERNDRFLRMVSQYEALTGDRALENQIRKFKCPICEYLLPKAADLKNHVKRHSEVGQITLTMYRCKYCSCMSTARTLLYEHLGEKHPGKPIALVKKIVAIDTAEVDKSFAETSVEENLDQLEEELQKDIMAHLNKKDLAGSSDTGDKPSRSSFEQLFVIPEGGERFDVPLQCPRCPFSSHDKMEIIGHVNGLHPEVKVIGSDEDVDRLARETKEELQQQREAAAVNKPSSSGDSSTSGTAPSQEDVLIVPDEPVFKEAALCSRCDFTTFKRKDMVVHLQRHHPDISVMGRNSYPMQVAALDRTSGAESQGRHHHHHGGSDSIIVGSGSLDAKIGCLYQNYGTQMRCLICGTERPKKFFIHVHILRHLNIYLWKCAFCPHRGLQKYKMVDHIKKIHPGKAMSVRYLRVDVEAKVRQFMQQFDISAGGPLPALESAGDGGDTGSRSSSPWPGKQEEASPSETSSVQDDDSLVSSSHGSHQTASASGSQPPTPLYTLGSESLDEKLNCLYDFSDGVFYKCLACPNQFQRRFAIHRHIIMAHLKVNLLKCGHCSMESVERHLLIDHSLACHSQLPISITALNVDLTQAVSDFLTRVASGEITDNSADVEQKEVNAIMNGLAADDDDDCFNGSAAENTDNYYNRFPTSSNSSRASSSSSKPGATLSPSKQQMYRSSGKTGRSGGGKGGFRSALTSGRTSGTSSKKQANAVDPDVIMLGREALDRELRCLYQPRPNGTLRCLVCRWEFPRKYPLHRHMMLKHLRLSLVGCPYCPFEGVEKYNVSSHIKEEHPDKPINIKYVSPDVRSRVKEFVDDMAMSGGARYGADLIKKPTSSRDKFSSSAGMASKALQLKLKMEKKDENDEEEEEDGDGDDEDKEDDGIGKKSPAVGGLVVAMFGKKKVSSSENGGDKATGEVKVKTEVEDDEYNDGETGKRDDDSFDAEDAGNCESTCTHHDGEDGGEGANEGDHNDQDVAENAAATGEVTLRRPLMESYAPGAYRPCGGKPKALDVITNIKVLKSRENGSTKFYCELCKFTSLHRSNIVRHIYKIHEKYQTHTCPVCNYQTLSLLLMEGHMEKSHPGVEYSPDSFTLNPPRSKPRFTPSPNYNVIGRSRPVLGPKSFQKRRQDMIASMDDSAQSSSKGPKQFACAYCHYETNTQEDILQHTRERHSNGDEGSNSNSSKSPSSSSASTSSFTFSSKPKQTASACWDGSKKAIKRSLSPGSSSSPYSAPSSFSRGLAGPVFREPAPPKRKKRFVFEKGDELIHCLDCGTRETSMGRMEDHCAYEHPGQPMNVKRIPAWRFVCKSCVVKTMATSKMKYHLNRHVNYRPYTCTNCGAFFPSPDQCRRHSRSQGHDDQYTYVAKSSGLSGLLDTQHENVVIRCHTCGEFTAPTVYEVREHHRACHAGRKFLWRDVERGFVCDASGEALPEFDDVPSDSTDVGYTTKMSLGAGASPMRFKCKTCDFSSSVIQAMKSHLKSHQPKGFMCAYCSRSFSGKEKLGRHQQCLHPHQPQWIIHLRRITSSSSSSSSANAAGTATASSSHSTRAKWESSGDGESASAKRQTARRTGPKASAGYSDDDTTFFCPDCEFTSPSLYHFRRHLANQHVETYTRHVTREPGSKDSPLTCGYCSFPAETEAEFSAHLESHFAARTRQCAHCDYSAYDRNSVLRHIAAKHPGLESKVVEIAGPSTSARGNGEGAVSNAVGVPLVVDMSPYVKVDRLSEAELEKFECVFPDVTGLEDDVGEYIGDGVEESDQLEEQVEAASDIEDDEIEKPATGYAKDDDYEVEEEEEEEEAEEEDEDEDVEEEEEEESALTAEHSSDFINDEEEEEEEEEEDDEIDEDEGIEEEDEHAEEEEEDEKKGEEEEEDEEEEREEEIDEDKEQEENENANEEDMDVPCQSDHDHDTEETEDASAEQPTAEELARQLGLVGDEETDIGKIKSPPPTLLASTSDTVILQFDGLKASTRTISHNSTGTTDALKDRKDATLLSAQIDGDEDNLNDDNENDDDEDEDEDVDTVTFDTDITLASPLPMISLGDGVALSPVTMDSPTTQEREADEMLLDV
ncbi:zinc finger protein 425 [Elysia marginata]|uniref:Zinc finger protein 425 n=1 Tax=Elysia marginata TaxID=1093978 RepID=A0AAV4GLS1_9GAST|nr:zinc finger protein 425 [Elysia marginata]